MNTGTAGSFCGPDRNSSRFGVKRFRCIQFRLINGCMCWIPLSNFQDIPCWCSSEIDICILHHIVRIVPTDIRRAPFCIPAGEIILGARHVNRSDLVRFYLPTFPSRKTLTAFLQVSEMGWMERRRFSSNAAATQY